MQTKQADEDVLQLLSGVGVATINIDRDSELDDPKRYDSYPLTNNDLVRFVIHLNNVQLDDKLPQIADANL